MNPEKEVLRTMLEQMYRIRYFELKVVELFKRNLIRGSTHVYLGQEAIAVGACAALNASDYIVSTHRGHGHCIAKGGDLKKMMAELLGKGTGYCQGKGGSMHIADPGIGILGANGIVGGGIPISVGAGLSSQLRGSDQVTVCFFGDGASNQGTMHEALNMAAIWKLPVVYICENNLYAVSMPASESLPVADVAARAGAYGMEGVVVDGNDVLAVYESASKAVRKAREGQGPSLVECKTYRWEGHYIGDPCVYRTDKEVREWKEKEPIKRFIARLLKNDMFSRAEIDAADQEARAEVEQAEKFAVASPYLAAERVAEGLCALKPGCGDICGR